MAMLKNLTALLHIGGNIGEAESVFAYVLPLLFSLTSATELKDIMWFNFQCQLFLFLVVVQIPLALTGKMAYVDIG